MFTWDKLKIFAVPLIKTAATLIIGHLIIRYLMRIIRRAFKKTKMDASLAAFLSKALNIIMHIILILSALSSLGVSTTGLLAALSAAAVGVAVALKDSLSNVAGGILLLISPRFATGDYISVSGDEGNVISVDLLHTTIRTLDNRRISIPNGILINSHIINYSHEPVRRVDLTFPVPYDADIKRLRQIIFETASKNPLILSEPEKPFTGVISYGDSAVNIISRCWCNTPDYWTVYYDLNEQIRSALAAEGTDIPYNQLDVHLKN